MKNNPIGILDSGIGGITILKEIMKILPNENYIYYSDSINNPYGEKSKEEILNIIENIVESLIKKNCKAIVFACNTATALAIDEIRKKYPDFIFVGTEPAYKVVYDYAFQKKTLVMATPATINSERFEALYNKYDNQNTILLPCSNLANFIENNDNEKIKQYLEETLPKEENIEVVVLGCTHYPLIKQEIKSILGNVIFYDSSKGVANQLKTLLENKVLLSENKIGNLTFFDSSNSKEKEKRFFEILNKN
ncbi:MAG: glutamate racemase [Firmicutes bacterium]|nr:glutamate racemase [Bacillota bacterium]